MLEIKENNEMGINSIEEAKVFLEKIRKRYLLFFEPVNSIYKDECYIEYSTGSPDVSGLPFSVWMCLSYEEKNRGYPFTFDITVNSLNNPDNPIYQKLVDLLLPLNGIKNKDLGRVLAGTVFIHNTPQFNQLIGICKTVYSMCDKRKSSGRKRIGL